MESINNAIKIISSLDAFAQIVKTSESPISVNPMFITADLMLIDMFDEDFYLLENEENNIRSVNFELYCEATECGVSAYLCSRDDFMQAYEASLI